MQLSDEKVREFLYDKLPPHIGEALGTLERASGDVARYTELLNRACTERDNARYTLVANWPDIPKVDDDG